VRIVARKRQRARKLFIPHLPDGRKCPVCGKSRFATERAAMVVIGLPGERRAETRAYLEHGWWHLTSDKSNRKGGAK
jgi:hypothetical protein